MATITVFLKASEGYIGGERIEKFPAADVEGSDHDRLRTVVARAYEETLGSVPDYFSVHFLSEPDNHGVRLLVPDPPALVAEDGAFFWLVGAGSDQATIGDVRRTRDAGLLAADPYAYASDLGGYGDHLLPAWDALLDFLDAVGGPGGGAFLLWEAARGLHKVVRRHQAKWTRRHGRAPLNLFAAVLEQRRWNTEQLARYLDIEESEAVKLLEALGYEAAGSGEYRWSNDDEKAALRAALAQREFLWQQNEMAEGDDFTDNDSNEDSDDGAGEPEPLH